MNLYVERRTVNFKEGIDVPRIFVQGKYKKPIAGGKHSINLIPVCRNCYKFISGMARPQIIKNFRLKCFKNTCYIRLHYTLI